MPLNRDLIACRALGTCAVLTPLAVRPSISLAWFALARRAEELEDGGRNLVFFSPFGSLFGFQRINPYLERLYSGPAVLRGMLTVINRI